MKKNFFVIFLFLLNLSFSFASNRFTISGISSGGFMANQMSTIYSSQFSGVATVAGGFYFCAENYLQDRIKKDSSTIGQQDLFLFEPTLNSLGDVLNPIAIFHGDYSADTWMIPQKGNPIYQAVAMCMGHPNKTKLALNVIKQNVHDLKIDSIMNIANQKALIFQGKNDIVLKEPMKMMLKNFYISMGVPVSKIKVIEGVGNHNFPTDKVGGIGCQEARVPYVASCQFDLAGNILNYLIDNHLVKSQFDRHHLFLVDQTLEGVNVQLNESLWISPEYSIAPYGYLYANDRCLAHPELCHLHIALHGCKMSDSYNDSFQDDYSKQINSLRMLEVKSKKDVSFPLPGQVFIENKKNQYGLLKFVLNSGYLDYAENNDLMLYFPQTWITEKNFPYNPKGCWDWYGWTGENYATNSGIEAKWLMGYIHNLMNKPNKFILPVRPKFEFADFPDPWRK